MTPEEYAALIREALEVVEEIKKCKDRGAGSDSYFYYVALRKPIVDKATALLPKIEAAVKEKPVE